METTGEARITGSVRLEPQGTCYRLPLVSPRLSICIPTYDRFSYLKEAVASARAQTSPEVEILIGDDGDSPDIQRWSLKETEEDARVRYEKTPGRLRLAGNWNFLARRARGEFLTLIGDDDRLLPEFAERLLAASTNDVVVVFANHHIIGPAGQRLEAETAAMTDRYNRASLQGGVLARPGLAVWGNAVPMSACIVRTSAVRRLGFKEDINTPEIELFARLVAEGAQFSFVPDYLAEYRVHPGSETSVGLTMDRLAEYLEPIAVEPAVEPTKRQLLGSMFVAGVSVRLSRGDVIGARRLQESRYYPPLALEARVLAQRCLSMMPATIAGPTYRFLRQLRARAH